MHTDCEKLQFGLNSLSLERRSVPVVSASDVALVLFRESGVTFLMFPESGVPWLCFQQVVLH